VSHSIYPALSGAKVIWQQMEMVSNNLANATSDGFKQHRMALTSERVSPHSLGNSYVKVAETVHDMSDGGLESTGVDTHLALQGRAFFVVEGDNGPILQRAGNFKIDNQGRMVNHRGQPVLGEGGPIEIPDRERMVIDKKGVVRTEEGGEVGRLQLVNSEMLSPMGKGQWRSEGGFTPVGPDVTVTQGALEKSNVDPIKGMVELVEASRYFEAYQKAMQTSDDLDGKANELMRSK
jgi:flagellar basal body rod protein FlgG